MDKVVPKHVAIIPDGNRRWARQKGLDPIEGYKASADFRKAKDILIGAKEEGVEVLTFWAFSTENWKRDSKQIGGILSLMTKSLKEIRRDLIDARIRFRHIGRKDRIPKIVLNEIVSLEKETEKFNDFCVQVCIDYGGRDEIVRAVNKVLKSGVKEVKEEDFGRFLDSADVPDPDLVIRTSGEFRTSGFMPFQSAYSEYYFSDLYFPDFDVDELRKAVREFSSRKRNFGK